MGEEPWRAKFSGGEPLVHRDDLTALVGLSRTLGGRHLTLHSNLTLLTDEYAQHLASQQVLRVHSNMPSFDPVAFLRSTRRPQFPLSMVLEAARTCRKYGMSVQFNVVMSDTPQLRLRVFEEIEMALRVADSWDGVSFIADDWSPSPTKLRERLGELLSERLGSTGEAVGDARSTMYRAYDRQFFVAQTTDWTSVPEVRQADVYIVPPGEVMTTFVKGTAYFKKGANRDS